MPIEVLMPALSPTMEKGNLAKWLKKEGDSVKSGDIIAEIETDKATMEVEAVDEGTLGKIVVASGTQGVKVNELIGLILEEGESADVLAGAGAKAAPKPAAAPAPSAPAAKPAAAPASAPAAPAPAAHRSVLRRARPGERRRPRPGPRRRLPAQRAPRWVALGPRRLT